MKFVSKNMNLRVVLRHGVPAEPMSGRNAIPGLHVKFESGLADVKDEDVIRLMLNHPGFNSDFIAVEDGGKDPFSDYRREKEPDHINTEIVYGHVGKSTGKKAVLTAEQKKLLKPMAQEMAKQMFKEMAPEMMKELLATMVASKPKKEATVPVEENSGIEETDKKEKTTNKKQK